MIRINLIRLCVTGFLIWLHAACSYAQPSNKVAAVSTPPTPTPTPSSLCPEVSQLLSILGKKNIYSQIPEDFFKTSETLLKHTQDKTIQSAAQSDREIDFVPVNGDWLVSAHSSYGMHENKIWFDRATFVFSPSCFKSPVDFIKEAKVQIGKGSYDLTLPPPNNSIKHLEWTWKDPDINKIRLMQVNASSTTYEIKVIIDPAPTDP